MRRVLVLAAVLSLMAAIPAHALPGFEAGARGMYWFPGLSADVKTTANGVTGEFDAKTTLGMENKNFPAGEAFVRAGNAHFRVGVAQVKFDGDKTLTDNVVFNGQTFAVSSRVISHLDLKMLDGEFQYDLLRPDFGAANASLGVIVKVKYVDGNVELNNVTTSSVQKKDFKAPIPMVGLAAGVGFLKDMVRADARATGVAYAGNHLFEGDAFASFAPFPFFRLQGGYRIIDLKIDKDDIVAKLRLNGPYVGAQLSF